VYHAVKIDKIAKINFSIKNSFALPLAIKEEEKIIFFWVNAELLEI
jgi:hypothetical protein